MSGGGRTWTQTSSACASTRSRSARSRNWNGKPRNAIGWWLRPLACTLKPTAGWRQRKWWKPWRRCRSCWSGWKRWNSYDAIAATTPEALGGISFRKKLTVHRALYQEGLLRLVRLLILGFVVLAFLLILVELVVVVLVLFILV